jgi:membrane fusion protein (multidrug efflux system)
VGALVTASQTTALSTISQLDPVYVDITQSSADLDLRRLANGSVLPASATVRLKLEDGSDYPLAGTIEFSEVSVSENRHGRAARQIPNPQRLLLPGMFVRIETPQGIVPNAVLAPAGHQPRRQGQCQRAGVDAANKVVQRRHAGAGRGQHVGHLRRAQARRASDRAGHRQGDAGRHGQARARQDRG